MANATNRSFRGPYKTKSAKGQIEPVTGPVQVEGVFKHYVVKPRGMRSPVGEPLRYFCDASVRAHLSAQSMYRAVDIIAIYTSGGTRLARVVKGVCE